MFVWERFRRYWFETVTQTRNSSQTAKRIFWRRHFNHYHHHSELDLYSMNEFCHAHLISMLSIIFPISKLWNLTTIVCIFLRCWNRMCIFDFCLHYLVSTYPPSCRWEILEFIKTCYSYFSNIYQILCVCLWISYLIY